MAYSPSNICTKDYWNRTTTVKIIVGGWVVYYFETCSVCWQRTQGVVTRPSVAAAEPVATCSVLSVCPSSTCIQYTLPLAGNRPDRLPQGRNSDSKVGGTETSGGWLSAFKSVSIFCPVCSVSVSLIKNVATSGRVFGLPTHRQRRHWDPRRWRCQSPSH